MYMYIYYGTSTCTCTTTVKHKEAILTCMHVHVWLLYGSFNFVPKARHHTNLVPVLFWLYIILF